MTPEYRDALKARLDECVEKNAVLMVDLVDAPAKCQLFWSKDGVEVVSGDGFDVRISLGVLARIMGEFDRFSLGVLQHVDDRCGWAEGDEKVSP